MFSDILREGGNRGIAITRLEMGLSKDCFDDLVHLAVSMTV